MDGIKFQLRGSDRGNDLVRAGDFVVFLQRLLAVLGEIDRTLNDGETRFYQIAQLEIGSAGATLHEVVQENHLARRHLHHDVKPAFEELIASISNEARPDWASPDVLVKLRELAEPLRHIREAQFAFADKPVRLDDDFRKRIDRVLGRDVTSVGEVVGKLDAINVHQSYRARLYQAPGEKPIACEFSATLRAQVVENLGNRVRIRGEVRRREDSERPFGVRIHSIEPLPDESDLPLFASLLGMVSDFPDIDPVEYVRQLRETDA